MTVMAGSKLSSRSVRNPFDALLEARARVEVLATAHSDQPVLVLALQGLYDVIELGLSLSIREKGAAEEALAALPGLLEAIGRVTAQGGPHEKGCPSENAGGCTCALTELSRAMHTSPFAPYLKEMTG